MIVISGLKYKSNAEEKTSSAWNLPPCVNAVASCILICSNNVFIKFTSIVFENKLPDICKWVGIVRNKQSLV